MFSQIRELLPFLAGLAFWPKVLVTVIVLALTILVLIATWAPRQVNPVATETNTRKPKQEPALQITSIDPYEIRDKINSVPPFQHDQMRQNYVGILVEWKGKFNHTSEQASGSVRVSLQAVPRTQIRGIVRPVWLDFSVQLSDYPQLKIMEKDAELTVTGRIAGFGEVGAIILEEVKISFP